jgi:hypothetical protein
VYFLEKYVLHFNLLFSAAQRTFFVNNNGKQYRRFEKYGARRKFLRKNYFPPIMSRINAIFGKIFGFKPARARGARYTATLKAILQGYTTALDKAVKLLNVF